MVGSAPFSLDKLLIVYALCANQRVFVCAIATRLKNRCNMKLKKRNVGTLFLVNRYVFVDVHLVDTTLIHNTIFQISGNTCLGLTTGYCNFFLQILDTGEAVSVPFPKKGAT